MQRLSSSHLNSSKLQYMGVVTFTPHVTSSEPSEQSLWPSHLLFSAMHSPEPHLNYDVICKS